MVFTKTIVHVHSNQTPFSFAEFVRGTLALIQYGRENGFSVRLNIQHTELLNNLIVANHTINDLEPKVYLKKDIETLYNDLIEFKKNTVPIMAVTTNWPVSPRVLSITSIVEFKCILQFIPAIYAEALNRVTNELLNINLSHTVPIIKEFLHTDIQYYDGFSRDLPLPTDYRIIYVDMNNSIRLNDTDTHNLAVKIRNSLDLKNNIMILSNNRELKNILTSQLTVNYIPNPVPNMNGSDTSDGPVESIIWTMEDDIVNFILTADTKKLYVFSEQSMPLERPYETAAMIHHISTQHFTFFYSKVDISPMPIFQHR